MNMKDRLQKAKQQLELCAKMAAAKTRQERIQIAREYGYNYSDSATLATNIRGKNMPMIHAFVKKAGKCDEKSYPKLYGDIGHDYPVNYTVDTLCLFEICPIHLSPAVTYECSLEFTDLEGAVVIEALKSKGLYF